MLKRIIALCIVGYGILPLLAMQQMSQQEEKALQALKAALKQDKKNFQQVIKDTATFKSFSLFKEDFVDAISYNSFSSLMESAESSGEPLVLAIVPTSDPNVFNYYDAHTLADAFVANMRSKKLMHEWNDPLTRIPVKEIYTCKYIFKKRMGIVYNKDFVHEKTYSNLYLFMLDFSTSPGVIEELDTLVKNLFWRIHGMPLAGFSKNLTISEISNEVINITRAILTFHEKNAGIVPSNIVLRCKSSEMSVQDSLKEMQRRQVSL